MHNRLYKAPKLNPALCSHIELAQTVSIYTVRMEMRGKKGRPPAGAPDRRRAAVRRSYHMAELEIVQPERSNTVRISK